MTAPQDIVESLIEGNGHAPTTRDLLDGIAAKVSRIDREFENMRDDRREDRELLLQVSRDLKDYAASMQRIADVWMEIYQRQFTVPSPKT